MGTIAKLLDTATNPNERSYGSGKFSIVPWDVTGNPADNKDRKKKIGSGDQSHGMAFLEFNKITKKIIPSDGISGRRPSIVSAFAVLEPDGFVLRLHEKRGEGLDNVWAPRLSVDHNHKHNERLMRSTIVIDQRDKQKWGTFADFFWIKDVTATLSQDELRYDDAGYLRLIRNARSTPTGPESKYHLLLNYYKKAGYLTDGDEVSQWKSVLATVPYSKGVPSGTVREYDFPCASTPIDIQDETVNGKVVNKDGDKFSELGLWADFIYIQEKSKGTRTIVTQPGGIGNTVTTVKQEQEFPPKFGPLGIDPIADVCPVGELRFGGFLWSDRKKGFDWDREFSDPTNPDNGKKEADLEDSPEFPLKTILEWLRPWIRTPRL